MRRKLYLLLFSILGINNIFSQTQTIIGVTDTLDGAVVNTCNGFIIDSGGQGGDGYGNDEDITFTVCADNPDDIINVQFNLFNLDVFDDNPLPGNNNVNIDQMFVYDGNSTAALSLGNYSGTALQGVLVQCTPQNTSGCLTFRFISNSNNAANGFFTASAACITPCDDPTAGGVVLSGITSDSIHACIGEAISFQELGSFAQPGFTIAEYKWDFMDGSSTVGQNVNHSYAIPGHYRVQLFVTDNNGCTNNNLTDIDVLVATPPNFVNFQGDTTLCIGESMLATATPLLYENTWTGFTGETIIENGCMTDEQLGVAQNVDVVQTGFSAGTTITNISEIVSLCMDMEHTYIGDLVISITCPNGQSVILHQQGGGGTYLGEPIETDNVDCSDPSTQGVPYSYCFTSQATQTWVEAAGGFGDVLPAGDYEPIQSLGGLVGCPANGVWTLTVVDNFSADDGTVFSFGLNLDPSLYPDVVEFTPSHSADLDSSYWTFPAQFASALSPSADTMLVTPTQAGVYSYQYNVINSFGCMNDTTFNITVTEFTLPVVLSDTAVCPGSSVSMIHGSQNNCNYTLKLYDSFGDGWNGNNLKVSLNGANTSHTIPDGGDFAQFQIPVSFGDNLTLTFDAAGNFVYECSYELLDCSGQIVVNGESTLNTTPISLQVGLPISEPVAFEWSPANVFGTQVNSTNPLIPVPNDLDITLKMYPVAHPLCIATGNMKVSLHPNSFPGEDSTVSFCLTNEPVDFHELLGPGASVTGQWVAPNASIVTMPIEPISMMEGDYTYSVNTNGCIGQATITVADFEQQIIPILSALKPNICLGEEVVLYDLTASNNVVNTFLTFGDGFSLNYPLADTTFTHLYDSIKSYSLTMTVTSQMGCIYSNNFDNMISVKQAPKANFFVNPDVITTYEPKANFFSQSSADAIKFEWDFPGAEIDSANTENAKATYPLGITGEYLAMLTVENFYGCRDSITKTVLIQDDLLMFIPNSFTPNGDIHNNAWEIAINGADPNRFSLKVFNRWGQLIFESNDPKAAWDGTYSNGGIVQDGMYQWRVNGFNTLTNQEFERSGYLNIFK